MTSYNKRQPVSFNKAVDSALEECCGDCTYISLRNGMQQMFARKLSTVEKRRLTRLLVTVDGRKNLLFPEAGSDVFFFLRMLQQKVKHDGFNYKLGRDI
jgi:hypothetical protein